MASNSVSPARPTSANENLLQVTSHLQALSGLLGGQADAAIWRRDVPVGVQSWLDSLPAAQLPTGRFLVKAADVSACITGLCEAAGLSPHPARDWLCEDTARLALYICDAFDAPYIRLRLEAVSDDACRKFHIDNLVSRLICTYRGPGTQISLDTSESDPSPIHDVPTGAPILLKGRLWPQSQDLTLRHRSPPISGTGITRLVLVLEGASEKDAAAAEHDVWYARH
ncbi:MAG: DUF1826 domain-containing protein [Pseudomonadota bacterium]